MYTTQDYQATQASETQIQNKAACLHTKQY